MKTIPTLTLALLFGSLIFSLAQQSSPSDSLAKAESLANAGNHREAADLAKSLLDPKLAIDSKQRVESLNLAADSCRQLGAHDEAESVIEQVAKDFAKDWRMLQQAALSFQMLPSHGQIIDGKFQRGNHRNRGEWKQATVRDRVRALQLFDQAVRAMPADAEAADRALLDERFIHRLAMHSHYNRAAWKLQMLTDLSKLPDFDDQEGGDETAGGYPVDEKGDPVFFPKPATWEAAASDAERMLWLIAEIERIGDTNIKWRIRNYHAEMLKSWFSVRSIAQFNIWGRSGGDDAKANEGIAALHTLRDGETVAKLATGPKRFTLPPDQDFMRMFRELAEDESFHRDWRAGPMQQLAMEHTDRRQFPKAAAELRQAKEMEEGARDKEAIQKQIDQITGNWARLEPLPPQPAGKGAKLSLVFRNAAKISFTARKVDVLKLVADTKAYLRSEPQDNREDWWKGDVSSIGRRLIEADASKYLGETVAKWETALEPAADHWDKRMEIATSLQNGGAYFIEGKVDKGNTARALLWIEDLVLVSARQPNGMMFFLADAVSGQPVADADVSWFGYRRDWKDAGLFRKKPRYNYTFREFTDQPDANGIVKASKGKLDDQNYQWFALAKDNRGRIALTGFGNFWFGGGDESVYLASSIYTVTDRPVYRPAQTLKWKAWVREASYDPKAKFSRWAGKKFQVEIHNPLNEKLFEQAIEADEFGGLGGEMALAEDATLGMYRINIWRKDEIASNYQFRVEEYKKPEFEVKVEAPEKPVALGDSFEVKVKADYYFGGPVKEGKVKYRIERKAQRDRWFPVGRWDWLFGKGYGWRTTYYDWYPNSGLWCRCIAPWPWQPWGFDPPELIAAGEQAIGADGTVKIKVDTAIAKEIHGDEDHQYTITAEVTDTSRRTIFGNGAVLAARRPYEVYVWLDRGYYQAGEDAAIRVAAKTLDGRAVKAAGEVKVYRLSYKAGQDSGSPIESEVASFAIKTDEDGEVMQRMKWDRAGQYRIAVKLKDDAGHETEGTAFTTVRGDGFENGKGLRFDDLELAVQKEEYSPGDEVEVLINTNRENARVALFIRATNGAYPDPVWLQLDGKSAVHRFKITEKDQPNLFIEAFTVSAAQVHRVTRQIIVPPSKHIATVELITDKKEYLPQQKSAVKLRVRDQHGQPFVGDVILTGYDKALEYISGGSGYADIREFFWSWKRSHSPSLSDSLRDCETSLMKKDELWMQGLGMFGDVAESLVDLAIGQIRGAANGGQWRSRLGENTRYNMSTATRFESYSFAGAPAAAPMAAKAEALSANMLGYAANELSNGLSLDKEGRGEIEGPQPMIRSNLADSAIWLASVKTNEAGEASLDFALPDNLTTWSLRSWVMGPQTQVGEAKVEIVTRKNLMVRLQAPRFFVEKDEVVISANVHNEMDKEQAVRAVLELEGGCLQEIGQMSRMGQIGRIGGHAEKRFDWRVKVTAPGEATIRVKALAEADSDALEMKFPVYVHGALKTDSWSLVLRPDQASAQIKLRVPDERKPEDTRLEVRWSPTLAMALVDALPYLADYPYGCTEQTLNRFVPTVVTLKVLQDLGVDLKAVRDKQANLNAQEIGDAKKRGQRWQGKDSKGKPKQPVFNEAEVKRMAKAGLQRLEAMRNGDGGWGWFPGGRESSEHITALVLHGLHVAKEAGADIDDGLVQPAIQFLQQHENEELRKLNLPEKHDDHKAAPSNLDALVHVTLAEYKQGQKEMRTKLYDKRQHLSRYNQALLGLACHEAGERDRRDMLLRNLRQFLKQDAENQTAYLDLPSGWWWWDDEIETQAAFLRLLVAVEPKSETAAGLAKYLLNNRRNGTYWNSTKDTAAVIESLAAFVKASGESDPSATVQVLVDGVMKKEVSITKGNLFAFDGSLVLTGDEIGSGEHVVEFRREGKSPLYANAYLTVFSKEDMIPAAGLEVKVQRRFYRLIEEKPDTNVAGSRGQVVKQQGFKYSRVAIASDAEVKSGDLVEVELTIESKNDYEYILIEDMKPAGYEPVEVRSGWTWDKLPAYQEFRDERVAFFAERLSRGAHNLSYRVKAEIPGRFSALPAKVEAMYAPELRGNSEEWKARVADGGQ